MLDPANHPELHPWFRAYPDRFNEEREKLEAIGFVLDEEKLAKADTVVFNGSLLDYPDRKLIITFPWSYPSIPPSITDNGECPLLSRHQRASTRGYCLFGPNAEAWYAGLYAVTAVEETGRLLKDVLEERQDASADPYPEPFSAQPVFAEYGTILVPPPISDFLPDDLTLPAQGMIRVNYEAKLNGKGIPRGTVIEASFRDKPENSKASFGYKAITNGREMRGRLTYLPSLTNPILNGSDFIATLKAFGFSPQNYDWHALIFPEQSGSRSTIRYSWLLFKKENNGRFSPVQTVTYRSAEKSARIPGLGFLPTKRIAIFGCGSIGSKIACSLASSGVKDFLLVDKDVLEPVNSVRHECGIDQFATPKAHALASRVCALNPDSVGTCSTFVGDPFGELIKQSRHELYETLAECDLIVNATGVQGLSRAICEISHHLSIPSIHVSVTNGAWSGEVLRYLPGVSRCWQCFQEAFKEPPPGQQTSLGYVFGPGCDQPTFTGTGYELDIVAGLATSFVVDTLRIVDGSDSEYDGDYLLWEGRDSTGKLLQRTMVMAVPARERCITCGECHES